MEKPITIRIGEFKNKLCELINEYKLPAYVLINEFNEISFKIKEIDLEECNKYNEYMEKESKKEGSEQECKK